MMRLDEGNGLLEAPTKRSTSSSSSIELDKCIDNPKPNVIPQLAVSLAMGNAADAVEIICVGFIMAEMGDITSEQKEFLSAAVFMGMLFGGVISGYVSDWIGRRPCLLYSLAINAIAGLASAAAPDINVLIACRVLGGLGIGGSVPIVFSMGAEMFPSSVRGKYLSLIASFWMVGAIYAAFTAWIMLGDNFSNQKIMPGVGWQLYAVVSAFPAIVALILAYTTIPESPRYLLEKGRYSQAAAVLNKLSTVTVTAEELAPTVEASSQNAVTLVTSTQTNPIQRLARAAVASPSNTNRSQFCSVASDEKHLSLVDAGASTNSQRSRKSTIALLFTGKLLSTCVILMAIWFTLSFGSYGISTWISLLFSDVGISNSYAASFIFALANLPGNIISILLIDIYGRRWLLSVGMCLAGVSAIGFAINTTNALFVVLCASAFNAFSVVGWNSLDALSVESFPTHVRTSAMGVLAAAGRVGAITAQFINGSLEHNVPLLLFITSGCSIFGGLCAWLLPFDTAGTLPEADEKLDDRSISATADDNQAVTGSSFNPLRQEDDKSAAKEPC